MTYQGSCFVFVSWTNRFQNSRTSFSRLELVLQSNTKETLAFRHCCIRITGTVLLYYIRLQLKHTHNDTNVQLLSKRRCYWVTIALALSYSCTSFTLVSHSISCFTEMIVCYYFSHLEGIWKVMGHRTIVDC